MGHRRKTLGIHRMAETEVRFDGTCCFSIATLLLFLIDGFRSFQLSSQGVEPSLSYLYMVGKITRGLQQSAHRFLHIQINMTFKLALR